MVLESKLHYQHRRGRNLFDTSVFFSSIAQHAFQHAFQVPCLDSFLFSVKERHLVVLFAMDLCNTRRALDSVGRTHGANQFQSRSELSTIKHLQQQYVLFFNEFCYTKPKLECYYNYTIDLESSGIPLVPD